MTHQTLEQNDQLYCTICHAQGCWFYRDLDYWGGTFCAQCAYNFEANPEIVCLRAKCLEAIKQQPPKVPSLYDLCRFQTTACEQQHRQWRGLPLEYPLKAHHKNCLYCKIQYLKNFE